MSTLKITTLHSVNFPGTWGDGSRMEAGVVGEFVLSAERVRKCQRVQVHKRDGSEAIEANVIAVHESKAYPGRVTIAYADWANIAPNPSTTRCSAQYLEN